eukprot:TRINITY_DN11127_c0_g1_i1.p1 TRINITY_DN11127_c0_g1~~TRINITY_DN11127_c0_g1_i1.p1  ORF type:complete len:639 (-),score=134.47 TRINITY_DN11127_c0_g1_i1:76-1992(-)
MHGLIHRVFKDFIIGNFGLDSWRAILEKAGIQDDGTILEMKQYSDDLTFAAIGIACDLLKVDVSTALELFGVAFVDFAVGAGFYNQLSSLGKDLFDLMTNLNLLHHNLERDLRDSLFPVFVIESKSENHDVFRLSYSSCRLGLEALIKGVLQKVAKDMFHHDLKIEVVQSQNYTGVPRLAEPHENTLVVWDLYVRPLSVPPHPKQAPSFGMSFFDLHAFFVACCCSEDDGKAEQVTFSQPVLDAVVTGERPLWHEEVQEVLHTKEVAVAAIHDRESEVPASLQDRVKIAKALFRGVTAEMVAAPWQDAEALRKASQFWGAYDKLDMFYLWSMDVYNSSSTSVAMNQKAVAETFITFLSHSWKQPDDWVAAMGEGCSYASIKATEICGFAKDIAARQLMDVDKWPEVHFWVDKCCIPQGHPELMSWCVNLIEEFITLSNHLVVILSWTYFERLWCVYEWVVFLVHHKPSSITLCADAFLRSRTQPLLIASIKNFSLASCKCFVESDRAILSAKVDAYYVSHQAFEEFLKFTAIALVARDMAAHRISLGEAAIQPWSDLAVSCGFQELADRLACLGKELPQWKQESAMGQSRALRLDMQTAIHERVQSWFAAEIDPLIEAHRSGSVRAEALQVSLEMFNA